MQALITGGSSGIGKAMALQLASAGYDIVLIARDGDRLASAADEIRRVCRDAGQRIAVYAADVTDRRQAEAAVAAAIEAFGPADLVVTSAGVAEPGYFAELAPQAFERAMAVNYFGTLNVIRAALPSMRARRSGSILLVSSGAALMGVYGYSAYGPSKFAVRGLAETLRAELRADNIRVSIAYPPDTETPMLQAERETMPPETRAICGLARTWTADAVAAFILRDVHRGAFAITPGLTLTVMRRFPGAIIPALRWYCDGLVSRVGRLGQSGTPPAQVRSPARGPNGGAWTKHTFMRFWYAYARTLNSIWPSITLEGKRLVISPTVYKPLENEHVASEYCCENDRVLDLGCGSGVGSVFCAAKAREVVAVDISQAAVQNTLENCRLHGLTNVEVLQSDMFSCVSGRFDLILANPPYVEDEFENTEQQFATSVRYVPTLFAEAHRYLAEGGRLVVQLPAKAQPKVEFLAEAHGLELTSTRPLDRRPLKLKLLSSLYLQIGFKSTLFVLRPKPATSRRSAETNTKLSTLKMVA